MPVPSIPGIESYRKRPVDCPVVLCWLKLNGLFEEGRVETVKFAEIEFSTEYSWRGDASYWPTIPPKFLFRRLFINVQISAPVGKRRVIRATSPTAGCFLMTKTMSRGTNYDFLNLHRIHLLFDCQNTAKNDNFYQSCERKALPSKFLTNFSFSPISSNKFTCESGFIPDRFSKNMGWFFRSWLWWIVEEIKFSHVFAKLD